MSKPAKWLFVSDVDDTLLGNTAALETLAAALQPARPEIILAWNSSRPCASLRQSLQKHPALPTPDFLIGALGTEIEDGPTGQPLDEYTKFLGREWNREELVALLAPFGFAPHPEKYQRSFKLSYDIPGEAAYTAVQNHLRHSGHFPHKVRTIFSMGHNLDLIPAEAGKGNVIHWLAQHVGVPAERVIVAGDSGNDLDMFTTPHPYKGIIVGNAEPALKMLESPHIYQATAVQAAGVLAGLQHWQALPPAHHQEEQK